MFDLYMKNIIKRKALGYCINKALIEITVIIITESTTLCNVRIIEKYNWLENRF